MNISTATLNRLHLSKTGVYESFISPVEAQALVAMIESTDRAWWWEKVEVGYEFRESEPMRKEVNQYAEEYLATLPFTIIATNVTYFIDTRWTPPAKPPKVGDVIETVGDLERLPEGAGFVDDDGDLWQVDRDECGETAGAEIAGGSWQGFTEVIYYSPFTVIYLPKVGGSDE